jgi:hypothetical protein
MTLTERLRNMRTINEMKKAVEGMMDKAGVSLDMSIEDMIGHNNKELSLLTIGAVLAKNNITDERKTEILRNKFNRAIQLGDGLDEDELITGNEFAEIIEKVAQF